MNLNQKQIDILSLLAKGARIVRGGDRSEEMQSLISAAYVTETSVNISENEYAITDKGRKVI